MLKNFKYLTPVKILAFTVLIGLFGANTVSCYQSFTKNISELFDLYTPTDGETENEQLVKEKYEDSQFRTNIHYSGLLISYGHQLQEHPVFSESIFHIDIQTPPPESTWC